MKLFIIIIMSFVLSSCSNYKKDQFIILDKTDGFTILLDTYSKNVYTIYVGNDLKPEIYKTNLSEAEK